MVSENKLNKKILLVDADIENREFFVEEFMNAGFDVFCTDEMNQIASMVKRYAIDAVVVDYELSSSERNQLAQALKSENEHANLKVPVLVILTSLASMSREDAYDLGAALVFSKPIDPSYLIERLNELFVPEQVRWKGLAMKDSQRKPVQIASSVSSELLGRGGMAVPLQGSLLKNTGSAFEGDRVAFDLSVDDNQRFQLKGTGIIRYIKSDPSDKNPTIWGIEFESLETNSMQKLLEQQKLTAKPSFIPKFHNLH